MGDWSEGYVTRVGYTHGYYRELAPSLQHFALLTAGFAPPADGPYLELGFGQGLSACIHAAATPHEVWGIDFNPIQVAHARHLTDAAGIAAHFTDDSFAQLLERNDLPSFGHIAAHGVWTWVSDANRDLVVEIIRRRLGIGGMAYLSYNSLPGWASATPLRHLMCLHSTLATSPGSGVPEQVEAAVAFTRTVMDAGSLYFNSHPEVVERLARFAGQNANYLAHEYFNRNWQPMHFADFANRLAPARLDFAASAHLLDQVDELNLTPAMQALMRRTESPALRETIRDHAVNQFFRRDLFLRGARRLPPQEQWRRLSGTRIALVSPSGEIPLVMKGPLGEIGLRREIYEPLIAALADGGHRPKPIGGLHERLPQIAQPQLIDALKVLVGVGHAQPAQDEAAADGARPRTRRLNRQICLCARESDSLQYLASPELGGGVLVTRIEQLFLLAREERRGGSDDWGLWAWDILDGQGIRIQKDGRSLADAADNVAELQRLAGYFARTRLPILQALGIAE